MSIFNQFAVEQALANIKLENFTVDQELMELIAMGMSGELTTTEIISAIVNG